MPVNIKDNLPAIDFLKSENIFVMPKSTAIHQDVRPLKIALLNLMPLKIVTETDLVRVLSNTPLQVELDLVSVKSHISKNTPVEHIEQFYVDFDTIKHNHYDGLIVTGAPVEHLRFEDVKYWKEITEIFDWASKNVTSSMFICWSSQAALYHFYGIQKFTLDKKLFGIYEHRVHLPLSPLLRGHDDAFFAPHSRYTTIKREDVLSQESLDILSESERAGVYLISGNNGKQIYVTGHSEYAPETLHNEYKRDVLKGLDIDIPYNYYEDNNPSKKPLVRWRSHANLLFNNWLNYYVYQVTPYNIDNHRDGE
jgi:homoserine O-succinyltransferase/O-acetyltransferase